MKLRAGIDPGNWRQKGDAVCAALAKNERPVVLALDELPILVNRMLKDHDFRITPAGKRDVDEFLSWLRKIRQDHRDRICLILSGSIGLEPILHQAGLSAHANIFSPLELKPWDEKTALDCLAALAKTCRLELPLAAGKEMCRRLRCLVPHHVQRFFDSLDEDLRLKSRRHASLEDVKRLSPCRMLNTGRLSATSSLRSPKMKLSMSYTKKFSAPRTRSPRCRKLKSSPRVDSASRSGLPTSNESVPTCGARADVLVPALYFQLVVAPVDGLQAERSRRRSRRAGRPTSRHRPPRWPTRWRSSRRFPGAWSSPPSGACCRWPSSARRSARAAGRRWCLPARSRSPGRRATVPACPRAATCGCSRGA